MYVFLIELSACCHIHSCTENGLFFSGYIAMFIHPFTWSFYTASVLVGIAAAGTV